MYTDAILCAKKLQLLNTPEIVENSTRMQPGNWLYFFAQKLHFEFIVKVLFFL